MSAIQNNKTENTGKVGIDKKAKPLKGIYTKWLKQIATWMERYTNKLSLTAKKVVIVCLLVSGGFYCFYQIRSAFSNEFDSKKYNVTSMSIPRHVNEIGTNRHPAINKKEFKRIHRYHLFLDSLSHSSSGRVLYNSIVHSRPGFIDSIRIIENIYQSQLKNNLMKHPTQSSHLTQQHRFLTALPLLVLPFVTMLFWTLGGGNIAEGKSTTKTQKGLNANLPDASLDTNRSLDKMSYYHLAMRDSNRRKKQVKNDPNYRNNTSTGLPAVTAGPAISYHKNNTGLRDYKDNDSDPNVTKVYQKLDALDSIINKPADLPRKSNDVHAGVREQKITNNSKADMKRMEQMMKSMNQPAGEDTEMRQLNNMLEKIIDIQHPDRIAQKLKAVSIAQRGQVYAVFPDKVKVPISTFGGNAFSDTNRQISEERNRFYSLNNAEAFNQQANAIQAVIQEQQTLVNGATVKLQLKNDIYINGVLIPKGHFIFGTASLDGERLQVDIKSIRYRQSLFPVALSVYDLDGMKGIYVPGAITRKSVKQSTGSAMQNLGLTSLNPSLGAQAAGAGIEAAKDIVRQKVKRVKVTVKAGYHVLLKNEKQ